MPGRVCTSVSRTLGRYPGAYVYTSSVPGRVGTTAGNRGLDRYPGPPPELCFVSFCVTCTQDRRRPAVYCFKPEARVRQCFVVINIVVVLT